MREAVELRSESEPVSHAEDTPAVVDTLLEPEKPASLTEHQKLLKGLGMEAAQFSRHLPGDATTGQKIDFLVDHFSQYHHGSEGRG